MYKCSIYVSVVNFLNTDIFTGKKYRPPIRLHFSFAYIQHVFRSALHNVLINTIWLTYFLNTDIFTGNEFRSLIRLHITFAYLAGIIRAIFRKVM